MKTLYLDLFSGISGDMFLGAMLDLGLDKSYLREQLALLDVGDYELRIHRSSRSSVEGVKFDVLLNAPQPPPDQNVSSHGGHSHSHGGHSHSHGGHSHSHGGMEDHGHDTEHARDFAQIKELIRSSALSPWVQEKAESVFHRIAVAEGKVHGLPPDEVHFHEVGAVDSIVDILGACIALESMGKPQVRASVVVEGTGFVHCAHGKFPVPTMATLSILGEAGIALTQCDLPYELVTPTGAALLAEFSQSFGLMKGLVAEKVGYGLGGRDIPGRPNVLRAVLGQASDASQDDEWESDQVLLLQTNLDDCHPEVLGHFMDLAFQHEALDVFYAPIQMKKHRPGVLLNVLVASEQADAMRRLILLHTSAFGVRSTLWDRKKLQRKAGQIRTVYGPIATKEGYLDGQCVRCTPEFDSCEKAALKEGVPLQEVYRAAEQALNQERSPGRAHP